MVLELTNNKRIDTELLERVMTEVEKRVSASPSMSSGIVYENESSGEALESGSRETKQLVDFLGKILQLVRTPIELSVLTLSRYFFYLQNVIIFCKFNTGLQDYGLLGFCIPGIVAFFFFLPRIL